MNTSEYEKLTVEENKIQVQIAQKYTHSRIASFEQIAILHMILST